MLIYRFHYSIFQKIKNKREQPVALKPTIYKFNIALSDLDRNFYDTIDLTLALHPSETIQRMMARVVAFCINAQESLKFTKGLSEIEEPDIWLRTLDDQIALWIDVGEPDVERIKKATHKATSVKVYSFNSKSNVWWEQSKAKFARIAASIYRFQWDEIQAFSAMLERTMALSMTIADDSVYITSGDGQCEIAWTRLSID